MRWLKLSIALLATLALAAAAALAFLWRDRPALDDLPIPVAEKVDGSGVTVTWLGITTLLFDDGETQLITDATFSRYPLQDILGLAPLESDFAELNRVIDEYDIDRLRAIVPLHSHFDHVIDAGHVANRTGAMVLGSESTANVARGSGVPVDQYQILQYGESRYFGRFTVTLLESRHVPQLPDGQHVFPGIIAEPLLQPQPASAWQSGAAYTLLVTHPAGTALVQGSAGYVAGVLDDVDADVAFLSIAGIERHGRDYARGYWRELVRKTGARRVFAMHFDDYTRAFGELALFPRIIDDTVVTAGWLAEFAAASEPAVELLRPPLGEPLLVFPEPVDAAAAADRR